MQMIRKIIQEIQSSESFKFLKEEAVNVVVMVFAIIAGIVALAFSLGIIISSFVIIAHFFSGLLTAWGYL